jgi:hypothetical protein
MDIASQTSCGDMCNEYWCCVATPQVSLLDTARTHSASLCNVNREENLRNHHLGTYLPAVAVTGTPNCGLDGPENKPQGTDVNALVIPQIGP